MIKAVIFDLDETLYDEMQFVRGGFGAVAEYIAKSKGMLQNEVYMLLHEVLTEYGRGKVFDIVLKQFSLYNEASVSTLVNIYRTHEPKLRLYPEVQSVLSSLRKKNYLLGLITDGDIGVQQSKVKALEIKDFFECIIFSNKYGIDRQKPSIFPYQKALQKLALKPKTSIYIGDNPYKDFVNAKKIGIYTVRIIRGQYKTITLNEEYEAEYQIKNLNGIFEVLEQIESNERFYFH